MTDKTGKKVPIQEIDDAALDDVSGGAISAVTAEPPDPGRTTPVTSIRDGTSNTGR